MSDTDIFTADERAGIAELRRRLSDLNDTDTGGESSLAKQYICEDSTMWRYVLAKSRDENPMDVSEEMFRSSIAWREELNMPQLVHEWRGQGGTRPCALSARARMGDLCFYAGMMTRRSATGGPVLVDYMQTSVSVLSCFAD